MSSAEKKRLKMIVAYFNKSYLDGQDNLISTKGLIVKDYDIIDRFLSMLLMI